MLIKEAEPSKMRIEILLFTREHVAMEEIAKRDVSGAS
jgi:hypothetical protein